MSSPAIDLSRLPAPDVVESLDYEALLAAAIARLGTDYVVSEADPAYKTLESAAYRELLLRQRVNDAARAVMLPTAAGRDLDNLAALLGVERQIVTPADPKAIPPVEAVYETDERLRTRTQLAPSAVSTAGPASSYRFHALSASADVLDVAVASPAPGSVTVTVLAREGNGVADADLLAKVTAALNDESVRPLGDVLTVQTAVIVDYQVTAELTIGSGPDSAAVLEAARTAATAYASGSRKIGRSIPRSALYAALHWPGVEAVALTAPAADVAVTAVQAAHATQIQVTEA
ncbi:MAG: baseplate J/gp47 family protein [Bryobacterales bacterium]|nr:baseplate J/gp47 family protein [Bryobacterales bacterium]